MFHRGKQASRKAEADAKKGKQKEEDGGGTHVKGVGGTRAVVDERKEKTSQKGSRLPRVRS